MCMIINIRTKIMYIVIVSMFQKERGEFDTTSFITQNKNIYQFLEEVWFIKIIM